MKPLAKTKLSLAALILAFTLAPTAVTSVRAETLEQAVAKATQRYEKKQKKKVIRDRVKAKYKAEIDALKEKQKAEIEAELEKTGGV